MEPEQTFHVGTSGFSYSEWKGDFYPAELPPRDYLSYFARYFSTTEINNTFYRSPSSGTTAKWAEQVPDRFRFTLKLTRKITHNKRLREVEDEMRWFLEGMAPLAGKLGALLVQLPPYFKENQEILEKFLKSYGGTVRLAFEFRNPSWFNDTTYGLLEQFGAALVIAESDKLEAVRIVNAPFLYLRLRRSNYSDAQLRDWAAWIRAQDRPGFAYLKHDKKAPRLASILKNALTE